MPEVTGPVAALLRLMVARVEAAGYIVTCVRWRPGDHVEVEFASPPSAATALIYLDEDLGAVIDHDDYDDAVGQIIDYEISRAAKLVWGEIRNQGGDR